MHTQKRKGFVNAGQHTLEQKTHDRKTAVLNQTTDLSVPISHILVVYIEECNSQ